MCFGNLSPIASRTSTSDLPIRSLAAANPARSGTVSRSRRDTDGTLAAVRKRKSLILLALPREVGN